MKSARIKSIFAGVEELRTIKNDLYQSLVACSFKPQEVPAAVIRLEKTHQKILQHAWRALKDDHLNASRQNALKVFNQYYNLGQIDAEQIKKLLDVPEIEDLTQYLEFIKEKKIFAHAVKDYLFSLYKDINNVQFQENGRYHERVEVLERPKRSISLAVWKTYYVAHYGWHESTPKDIRKIQHMLKNAVPARDVNRTDEFYLQKFASIADFFLGMSLPAGKEVHEVTQAFYERQVKAINAVEYVPIQPKLGEPRLANVI